MAGGKIDILVNPDVKDFPKKLERGLGGTLGMASKIGASLGAALGGAAVIKSVASLGAAFDKELNNMKAVSGATEAQLGKVSERALDLGKSADLTATSAADAASAMTELAKGGFSVEDSMAAAKGTLQLASAAQIDAASAATIQSQALQAFGLDASYAATASDVLAGAANASSAEIRGISDGLQQSGAVANQFGLSIEDNATALAMFANAGIQGSDAGTLLKSALLSFTKETRPARSAIEELGLTVWDANGDFVGMEQTFRELSAASKEMTTEQYASATAALFGSDAARMAGIAAREGAEGWNETYKAVTRSGQAAEVAAAQASGLPGVLEAIENQAEDTGIAVYNAFKDVSLGVGSMIVSGIETAGPMVESAAVSIAAGIETITPSVERVISIVSTGAGEVVGVLRVVGTTASEVFGGIGSVLSPVADSSLNLAENLDGIIGPLALAGGALAIGKWKGWGQSIEVSGTRLSDLGRGLVDSAKLHEALATRTAGSAKVGAEFGDVQDATRVTLRGLTSAMETQIPAVGRAADAYRKHGEGLRTYSANSKRWAAETRAVSDDHHSLASSVITAKGAVSGFAGQLGGGVAAAGSMAKSALGGVVNFFGGPLNVAIAAGTLAVTGFMTALDDSREAARLLGELGKAGERTAGALNEAFSSGNAGELTSAMRDSMQQTVDDLGGLADTVPGLVGKPFRLAADGFNEFIAAVKDPSVDATRKLKGLREEQNALAEEAKLAHEALSGMDLDELAATITGAEDEYRKLYNTLADGDKASQAAAEYVREARIEFLRMERIHERLAPGALAVSDAFETLGDEASSAEDRVGALRTVLDTIFDTATDEDDAVAALYEGIDKVTASAEEAAAAGVVMQATFKDDGSWDFSNEHTRAFRDELKVLSDEFLNAAMASEDVYGSYEAQGPALEALAGKYRVSREEVERLYRELGGAPDVVQTAINIDTTTGTKGLGELWAQIKSGKHEAGKPITLKVADDDAIAAIEAIGGRVRVIHDEAGEPVYVEVTFDDDEAQEAAAGWVDTIAGIVPEKHLRITQNVDENIAALKDLDIKISETPDGDFFIDANTPQEITNLIDLGVLARDPITGTLDVVGNVKDALGDAHSLDSHNGTLVSKTFRVFTENIFSRIAGRSDADGSVTPNAQGSVRTAASGHARLSQQEPQIAPGGSWLVWAEDETEGESFIPHAPAKRKRATQILAETARIFGLSLLDRAGSVVRRDGSNLDPERAQFYAAGAVRRYGNQMLGMSRMDTWMTSEQNKRYVEQLAHERSQRQAAATEAAILLRVSQKKGDKSGERQAQGLLDDLAERGVTPTAKAWAAADKWNYVRDDFGQTISDRLEKVNKAEEKRARHLEAAQKTYGTVSEYLGAMADHAETLAQIQHEMHMERIEIRTANMSYRRGLLDTLIAEQDVTRVRAEGAVAVADAEAALRAARDAAAMKGSTSIDAMSQALDRARRTGIFAIEDVAASVIDNTAAVREAQAAVEAARVQAAANEQNAVRNLEQMKLDMAEAQLRQQAAANALAISSDEEKKLRGLLGNVSTAQGRKLAHDWNERSYVEQLAVVGRLSEKQLAALDSKTEKQLRELQYQVAVARDAAALQRDALERSVASEQARIDAARMESELRARSEQEAYAADIEIAGLLGRIASAETAGQAQALSDAAIIAAERRDAMLAAMELGFKASTPKTTNPSTVRITLPARAESVSRADFETVVDTLARVITEIDIRMETSAGDYLSART